MRAPQHEVTEVDSAQLDIATFFGNRQLLGPKLQSLKLRTFRVSLVFEAIKSDGNINDAMSLSLGRVGLSGPERALPGRYCVRPSRKREGDRNAQLQRLQFGPAYSRSSASPHPIDDPMFFGEAEL